jgi:hypothetical protein
MDNGVDTVGDSLKMRAALLRLRRNRRGVSECNRKGKGDAESIPCHDPLFYGSAGHS